jgi:hypothetical protein
MRSFACPTCSHLVFFENNRCLNCGTELGFDPDRRTMVAVGDRPHCANHGLAACNWMVADPATHSGLCLCCRLTRTRPDDDDAEALAAFADAEAGKRRLVFELQELGLPVTPYDEDTGEGVAFDLLSSRHAEVLTGHEDGVITLDLAESDDLHREKVRIDLGEAYRTVLGHLRHEIGHYYWPLLVQADDHALAAYRDLFGDETVSYADELDRHYNQGPPAGWEERYVSAYATMHPWEDWAETFAHYLHIRDALETAASFGLEVTGPDAVVGAEAESLRAHPMPDDDLDHEPFAAIVQEWLALSYALNAMSRSIGKPDLYPFVLAPTVIDKLAFVHRLVGPGSEPPKRRRFGFRRRRAESLPSGAG